MPCMLRMQMLARHPVVLRGDAPGTAVLQFRGHRIRSEGTPDPKQHSTGVLLAMGLIEYPVQINRSRPGGDLDGGGLWG